MIRKPTRLVARIPIRFTVACSKTEPEVESEAQPAAESPFAAGSSSKSADEGDGGNDPTVVDPDHYATEFENDAVGIVRITHGAGEESIMHYHPDSVGVFLTDHLVQMTMPDGSTDQITAKAGDAIFIPGGQHLPKNIPDPDWKSVLTELKG